MFQNSRPLLSNRAQSFSSTTSMLTRFIAWVTLRIPSSNAYCNLPVELVRQQEQSGSRPTEDCGVTTAAPLANARSLRYFSHSLVRNGMSQPTIRHQVC